jgi:DNA-binding transcriptional LysR family regulator
MRVLEDELDVLLFDRSSKHAQLTPAGKELLLEGNRLLLEMDSIANRVKRVATGWEPELTIAFDSIISQKIVLQLVNQFLELNPPTRLRLRYEVLSGTWESLLRGEADIAIGVSEQQNVSGVMVESLGKLSLVFVVSPNHSLANYQGVIDADVLMQHRAIAVADSARHLEPMTIGLLPGQDVLTVPTMDMKIQGQLKGLGCGFLPESIARPYLENGQLIQKEVLNIRREVPVGYAWRATRMGAGINSTDGLALRWWLEALSHEATRLALLQDY